jgi:hypothetical protein
MENTYYIIGQIIGIIAIIIGFISYQMKEQKNVLLLQFIVSGLFCIHYLLINATSGMALNVIMLIRGITYYLRNKFNWKENITPIIFAVIVLIVSVISWQAWYSIFIVLGLLIHTLCMAMNDAQKVRKSILITSPLVLIYNVFVLSIGGIIYESIAIISSIIGIIKYNKNN